MDTDAMLDAALEWHKAGFSVIRVRTDGTKAPVGEWGQYQTVRAREAVLISWFGSNYPGLGICCGAASGNSEFFEFEGRATQTGVLRNFTDACHAAGLGETWRRICDGYSAMSPSGGLHTVFRVEGMAVLGNTKLAQRPDESGKPLPLIETRGQGGQFVAPPSHGPVHPTGKPWVVFKGSPASVVMITAEEYTGLHSVARTLDEMPIIVDHDFPSNVRPMPDPSNGGMFDPGADFNLRGSWDEVLLPHGWVRVYGRGDKSYWRRPGKRIGVSAVCGGDVGDFMTVFSTSTVLPTDRGLSKWRVFAMLNHGGDFSAAARELRTAYGMGTDRPFQPASTLGDGALAHIAWFINATLRPPDSVNPDDPLDALRFMVWRSGLDKMPDPEPLIFNTLDRGSVAMLAGHRGTYKSFIGLDMAATVADGGIWQGREAERANVLYVAAEGALGMKNRVNAWELAQGVDLTDSGLVIWNGAVNLGKVLDVQRLIWAIQKYEFTLIIIDTLARCSTGLEENSAKDMGIIVENLYRLLAATPGGRGTILLLHHTGKDGLTIRGSSALEAGFDTVYLTRRDDEDDKLIHLERIKRKDGPEDDHLEFKFFPMDHTESGILVAPGERIGTWRETATNADRLMLLFKDRFYWLGGASNRDLVEASGLPRSSVIHGLSVLVRAGRLVRVGNGPASRYRLGPNEPRPED